MFAQAAEPSVWTHPVTLVVIGAVLTLVGAIVQRSLSRMGDQMAAQAKGIEDLRREVAVLQGSEQTASRYEADRWARMERDLAQTTAAVGTLHTRVDQVMAQLAAGNPEVRRP